MYSGRVFIGVDPSLGEPGFAVLSETAEVLFSSSFPSGPLRGGCRLAEIQNFLWSNFNEDWLLAGACMEGPSLQSTHREFDLGEASGVLRAEVFKLGFDPLVIPPSQLKLFATGTGKATKEDVIHSVKKRWGYDAQGNDNIADALALARLAYVIATRTSVYRSELDVVNSLLHPVIKKTVFRIRKKENL